MTRVHSRTDDFASAISLLQFVDLIQKSRFHGLPVLPVRIIGSIGNGIASGHHAMFDGNDSLLRLNKGLFAR